MPITDPNERARRAVIRAIDDLTDLVAIVTDDPGDQNPDPFAFQVEPDDLFNLRFSSVGITNEALISGFVPGLKKLLPEIRNQIQELLGGLEPDVQIRLVFNVVRRLLASPNAAAATKAAATKGSASKDGASKSAAKKGGATKAGSKKMG